MPYIDYCPRCRDVCLSDTCRTCGRQAVRVEGSLDEFKAVLQALTVNRKDWYELLDQMRIKADQKKY